MERSGKFVEFQVPEQVTKICRILSEHGEDGYLVGGSLRDLLLENVPDDWDLATTATPDKMLRMFHRVIPTGIEHGTVTVLMDREGFEVTTLRSEKGYSDGRHPDSVKFVTGIEEDLSRRDFTVNAIAWNPLTREIFDPFDGERDLRKRRLVAVGNAETRFNEDGLRIMRAARFAATLEFEIEPSTADAIPRTAHRLENVSVERKRDEFLKLMQANRPSRGLRLLLQNDVFKYVCPTADECRPDSDWDQTLAFVDSVPAHLHLRLVAFWTGIDARKVTNWLERFLIDRRTRKQVLHLLQFFSVSPGKSCSDGTLRRYISEVGKDAVPDLLVLLDAYPAQNTHAGHSGNWLRERLSTVDWSLWPLTIGELAVSGADLISELGISPGPRIGEILAMLLDSVLEHPEDNTADVLLSLARKKFF